MADPRSIHPPVRAQLRQLLIPFDSPVLQAMSASERANALMYLTHLLLQAANVETEDVDDDIR